MPNLVWLAEHLEHHSEMETSPRLLEQLGCIGVSTVQRWLAGLRQDEPRLPCCGPKRANSLTRECCQVCGGWLSSES